MLNNSLFLPLSIFVAPHGSVFQSDGKNRQGEKDVVTDTVYVAGRYRPAIGECLFVCIYVWLFWGGVEVLPRYVFVFKLF